jgi:hypothetical protein
MLSRRDIAYVVSLTFCVRVVLSGRLTITLSSLCQDLAGSSAIQLTALGGSILLGGDVYPCGLSANNPNLLICVMSV